MELSIQKQFTGSREGVEINSENGIQYGSHHSDQPFLTNPDNCSDNQGGSEKEASASDLNDKSESA